MFSRMLSAILTLIPLFKYGTEYLNLDTTYQTEYIKCISMGDSSSKSISSIANFLRNFGLLLMSACSVSSGVSERFKDVSGLLAQKTELAGGIGYGLTAVMDWSKNYGTGYSLKILSSSLCQASVGLAAAKKEVERFRRG
jgi:hypothetical protein